MKLKRHGIRALLESSLVEDIRRKQVRQLFENVISFSDKNSHHVLNLLESLNPSELKLIQRAAGDAARSGNLTKFNALLDKLDAAYIDGARYNSVGSKAAGVAVDQIERARAQALRSGNSGALTAKKAKEFGKAVANKVSRPPDYTPTAHADAVKGNAPVRNVAKASQAVKGNEKLLTKLGMNAKATTDFSKASTQGIMKLTKTTVEAGYKMPYDFVSKSGQVVPKGSVVQGVDKGRIIFVGKKITELSISPDSLGKFMTENPKFQEKLTSALKASPTTQAAKIAAAEVDTLVTNSAKYKPPGGFQPAQTPVNNPAPSSQGLQSTKPKPAQTAPAKARYAGTKESFNKLAGNSDDLAKLNANIGARGTKLGQPFTSSSGVKIPFEAKIASVASDGSITFKPGPGLPSGATLDPSDAAKLVGRESALRRVIGVTKSQVAKTALAAQQASSYDKMISQLDPADQVSYQSADDAAKGATNKPGSSAQPKPAPKASATSTPKPPATKPPPPPSGASTINLDDLTPRHVKIGGQIAKASPNLRTAVASALTGGLERVAVEAVDKRSFSKLIDGILGKAASSPETKAVLEASAKGGSSGGTMAKVGAKLQLVLGNKFIQSALKILGPALAVGFGIVNYMDDPTPANLAKQIGIVAISLTFPFTYLAWMVGYGAGTYIHNYFVGDTKDLHNSIKRQAKEKLGLLVGPSGYDTIDDEEFGEAARKANFNGLTPKEVNPARKEVIINVLVDRQLAARAGSSVETMKGNENWLKTYKLLEIGYLDDGLWIAAAKKSRQEKEKKIVEVKPSGGGEKQGGGKEDQAVKKTKKKGGGAALKWDSYIEKTGSIGNKVKSGFEELAKAGKVNNGNYSTWLKFYNSMRKDKPTMDAIGAKVGSHLSPSQIIKIYEFVMDRSENIKEALMLNNIIWESNLKRKIIKTQKLINLID